MSPKTGDCRAGATMASPEVRRRPVGWRHAFGLRRLPACPVNPSRGEQTDGWRRTDGQTDRRTDGRTSKYGRTDIRDRQVDRWTDQIDTWIDLDGRTDGRTDGRDEKMRGRTDDGRAGCPIGHQSQGEGRIQHRRQRPPVVAKVCITAGSAQHRNPPMSG